GLTTAPVVVKYRNVNKNYLLIPANFTAKYLGISYTYDSKKRIIHYAKPSSSSKPTAATSKPASTTASSGSSVSSTYSMGMSRSSYIAEQMKVYPSYGGSAITSQK